MQHGSGEATSWCQLLVFRGQGRQICWLVGATENAGVENVAQAKMQGWKMQE